MKLPPAGILKSLGAVTSGLLLTAAFPKVGQPMLAWVGILLAWRLFGPIFRPIHGLALNLLHPGAGYQ